MYSVKWILNRIAKKTGYWVTLRQKCSETWLENELALQQAEIRMVLGRCVVL